MKIILNIIILVSIVFPISIANAKATQIQNKKLYVLANNGLTLRKESTVKSEKITVVPYGSIVEVLEKTEKLTMKVDNITGDMFKVKYNDLIGYIFSGYLSKFPAPIKNSETIKYVDILRENSFDVYFEEIKRDYNGYYQHEVSFSLPTDSWEEAFLIAKQFYGIPEKINFPDEAHEKIENPDKEDEVWHDEITRTKDETTGELVLYYSYRREGGGFYITVKKDSENNGFRITHTSIAD